MRALSSSSSAPQSHADLRAYLGGIVAELDHLLPAQAPILNFVHHNTLHAFQHLPFEQALAEAERVTGVRGYLPEAEFRRLYANGRINDEDLDHVFDRSPELMPDNTLLEQGERKIRRRDVYRIAMVFGTEPMEANELRWSIEELGILDRVQADVPPAARRILLESIKRHQGTDALNVPGQEVLIGDLWRSCVQQFGLDEAELHPEELTDLSVQQAERLLGASVAATDERPGEPVVRRSMLVQASETLGNTLSQVGVEYCLPGLLRALTGQDVLDHVRPVLIRYCGSFLDEGLGAWHAPNRAGGFYGMWKESMVRDWSFHLSEMFEWSQVLVTLPENGDDALIAELQRMELPASRWKDYLTRVALDLPGWSGMINWRATHGDYRANSGCPVTLTDYLAVRLILDRLWLDRLCHETWGIPANLATLGRYLQAHLSEFTVRHALGRGHLPEYLAATARQLVDLERNERHNPKAWRNLADLIFTWSCGTRLRGRAVHTVHGSAWRLFRLAQHLGLTAPDVRALSMAQAERLLRVVDECTPARRAYLWLQAYERHYRDEVFAALAANHARGLSAGQEERPEAQIIFCMDDREEGIRRHLEEINPALETLGAAGFFGIAMNWCGLDDESATALCPIVVKPAHEVREIPRASQTQKLHRHRRRLRAQKFLVRLLNHELRRNLFSSHLLTDAFAPASLLGLIGKVFFPSRHYRILQSAKSWFIPAIATEVALTATDDGRTASPEHPRVGFTDAEQADRVATFLRSTGLTGGFAPLVVLMGHGSISQNNPHLAAYDCGACSGRHGGPNARAFAAMANRPEVRRLVAQGGIEIPHDTWFVGAEHNTSTEEILWFDISDLPPLLRPAQHKLKQDLDRACQLSAHERCRRFASAPPSPTLPEALRHVAARSTDYSQPRPELGHATNAAALIGRRSMSRGIFLDRRVFLISYDATQDPSGTILEGILLAVGPVGAGINLEYYFSTVNNERFGCGTKVPHNVTGLFGVMEGASGDLRTGLPRQMIEIHEAMRLLVVVEHEPEVLRAIYERQPSLRELIGNGWIQLATMTPADGEISLFHPNDGFLPWICASQGVPTYPGSMERYAGHDQPLPAALIRAEPERLPREPIHA